MPEPSKQRTDYKQQNDLRNTAALAGLNLCRRNWQKWRP